MQVVTVSDTVHNITFKDGRKLCLVGTAHISSTSVEEVKGVIEELNPDRICLELDEGRLSRSKKADSWENMDMVKVFKEKKGFLLLANTALASFQKRLGAQTGVTPGSEFLEASKIAEEKSIPLSLCDRPIQQTLRRAWSMSSLWNKSKLLASLISAAFSKEEITPEELEALKNQNSLDSMLNDVAKELPSVKKVLIDERDLYLSSKIFEAPGNNKLAIVGAGHTPGILANLEKLENEEDVTSTETLEYVPPGGPLGKIAGWLIPALIIFLVAYGIIVNGWDSGLRTFCYWALVNGGCTLIFSMLALAHPINVIACTVTAPVFVLCPVLGVGMLGGVLEASLRKPKVKDFESLNDDSVSLKGWYHNRILHCLLAFLLPSVGSIIGTFVAFPMLIARL